MPLLNRKPYAVDPALPQGLQPDEEVWVLEASGEVFRDYAAFVKKAELYKKPAWSCKYTGRGGLTFAEAVEEERRALAALAKFPAELEERVLRGIHHSTLAVEPLVTQLYESLRPARPAEEAGAATPAAEAAATPAAEGPVAPEAAGDAAASGKPTPEGAAAQQAQQVAGDKSKKPKAPKAPMARGLLKTFLLEHAEQQGPEGGRTQVWVVKPELVAKYQMPSEIPAEIQAKLAASVKPPRRRPSDAAAAPKSHKKARQSGKAAAAASPEGKAGKQPPGSRLASSSPQPAAVAAGKEARMAVSGGGVEATQESRPAQPVTAKSLEEVEAQYKPGSIKAVMVQTLKAVPEGLTLQGLVDKAKELGLMEFDEKQKNTIRSALSSDANFVRLGPGTYSLHALHSQLVVMKRPPLPKKRKITEHFFADEEGQEGAGDTAGEARVLPKVESKAQLAAGEAAEQEVDGVTKAERLARQARAAAEKHRAALGRAQQAFEEAKRAHAEAKKQIGIKSPTKGRESDVHIPAEALAQFDMSEEERRFKGDEDDRKALMEHRQWLQRRAKELEAQKKAFIEGERKKAEAEKARKEAELKAGNTQYKAAEAALKKREHELATARRAAESAEKALADAERRLGNERKKAENAGVKAKEKEERERQRQAEREERERRKAEALAAKEREKRYPMEDLQLLQELTVEADQSGVPPPPTDVHQPSWLGREEQGQLSGALCVSDFLHQFGKALGVRALSFVDLERVLAGAGKAGRGGRGSEELGAAALHGIYLQLLQVLLDDLRASGDIGATEKRWRAVLREATWPEVLRRFVLRRAHSEEAHRRVGEHVSLAANMLAFDSADGLTHDQHLALLRFLCDEALDTEKMRSALQKRADGADDAKREILKDMAEERKKLREIEEQGKEERRRQREEKKRQDEEKAAAAAAAAAAGEGAKEGEAGAEAAALSKQPSMDPSAATAAGAGTPAEPCFELPEHLQEYRGDPDDKKSMIQFRQQQQAERRLLEKAKAKWLAEQLRRSREIEAKLKEQREAEKAKQKERDTAAEAIQRAQEELEEALERYSTRRLPLGLDRHHRRYWWGLGAHRPALYVEDEEGRWGAFTSAEEVEALIDSLDRRGQRESALLEALNKRFHALAAAVKKAAQQEERERAERGEPAKKKAVSHQPVRRSARETHQVEFFDPTSPGSKDAARPASAAARPSLAAAAPSAAAAANLAPSADVAALFGPAELSALEGALADAGEVLVAAEAAAVEAAAGAASWAEWVESLRAVAEGSVGDGKAGVLRSALQARLSELEAAVYGVSDKRDDGSSSDGDEGSEEQQEEGEGASEGSEESEQEEEEGQPGAASRSQSLEVLEYVDSDGELSPTKVRDVTWLWRSAKERATWQADLNSAPTMARIAYCAAVLAQQAGPLLAYVQRTARAVACGGGKAAGAEGGRGGGNKRKQETEEEEAARQAEEEARAAAQARARDARRAARHGSPPPAAERRSRHRSEEPAPAPAERRGRRGEQPSPAAATDDKPRAAGRRGRHGEEPAGVAKSAAGGWGSGKAAGGRGSGKAAGGRGSGNAAADGTAANGSKGSGKQAGKNESGGGKKRKSGAEAPPAGNMRTTRSRCG